VTSYETTKLEFRNFPERISPINLRNRFATELASLLIDADNCADNQPGLSGNSPGSQREASAAGNASRRGARGFSDTRTPLSTRAETMRRA
jgi:hypothetical protein